MQQPADTATAAAQLARLEGAARLYPADALGEAKTLSAALAAWAAAGRTPAALEALNATLRAAGLQPLSRASAYRKAAAMERGGVAALADGRRRARPAAGLAENREFRDWWATLVTDNARATAPAYRALMRALRSGRTIPGVGSWREIWAREHGGAAAPAQMVCPYTEEHPPRGMSRRALYLLAPDAFGLAAARAGMGAAVLEHTPAIIRTRAGLAPCQVVQIDDMWHEAKVSFAGNKHAQRVVELSMVDVLTGKALCWLTKPIRERDDDTRETLRGRWVRYLLAHLLCDIGIPAAGCLIQGEHGTATVDAALEATLAEVSGGRVRFGAGGILGKALADGLPGGRPHGNPRYKALIEGFHALIKNDMGATPGIIGGGRGREPEAAYGLAKQDEQLRRIADALEATRPGILRRLRLPFIPFDDFLSLVAECYARLNARTTHKLEGWEACGFVSGEFRAPGGAWAPIEALDELSPDTAAALRAQIGAPGGLAYRQRRMSPAEAFESRRAELTPLPPFAATLILGKELAVRTVCAPSLQLPCKDAENGLSCTVAGVLEDGTLLHPAADYLVWVNPLSRRWALIADAAGRYLGRARIQTPARADAAPETDAALREQLGIRQQAITAELRRLEPVIRARQARAAQAAEHNARELLGYDPAEAERTARVTAAAARAALRSAPAAPLSALAATDPQPAPAAAPAAAVDLSDLM